MKKLIQMIPVILVLAFPATVLAGVIKVRVNGMVCGFCAQGITKKFSADPSIASVDVKLSDKTVTLKTIEGKDITNGEIEKILKDAGYNVEKIER